MQYTELANTLHMACKYIAQGLQIQCTWPANTMHLACKCTAQGMQLHCTAPANTARSHKEVGAQPALDCTGARLCPCTNLHGRSVITWGGLPCKSLTDGLDAGWTERLSACNRHRGPKQEKSVKFRYEALVDRPNRQKSISRGSRRCFRQLRQKNETNRQKSISRGSHRCFRQFRQENEKFDYFSP